MPLFRFDFVAMGTPNALQLWAPEESTARRAADAAIADVRRIEAKYSRYRDDSVVGRVNAGAGRAPVAIDAETAALLHYADRCHALSAGRFDLTSGALRQAWDFRRTPPRVPDAATIARARERVGWSEVQWDARSIRLPRAGMEIDLGGIGKEYAADRAATLALEHGIGSGLVNLGGDVRVLGPQPDGSPWRVGIVHPRAPPEAPGATIAGVDLTEGAVATSGDYERFFEIEGRRYCHIVNALTGWPVRHWQSVSVVAPLCVVAGTLATLAMLLEDEAEAFLAAQGATYLAVASDGTMRGNAVAPPPATGRSFPKRRTPAA